MKKTALFYCLISFIFSPLWGFTVRKGENVCIGHDETVSDDLLIFARDIDIEGAVNGDLYAFGQTVTIKGPVSGTVISAGMDVDLLSQDLNTAWAGAARVRTAGKVKGNLVMIGGNLVLEKDALVSRDLRAYGGDLSVDGEVEGFIVGGVGKFNMAGESGPIYMNADNIIVRSSARINGEVEFNSENDPVIEDESSITGRINIHKDEPDSEEDEDEAFFALFPFIAFLAGIFRVFMFLAKLLTGILLIALGRNYVVRVMSSLKTKPWHCLGWGFVGLLVIPAVGFVLFLTLIGIPLAVFTFYVFSILLYLSSIMVALVLGELIMGMFKKKGEISLYLSLIIGQVVIFLVCLIPFLGFIIKIAILLFGTGMLLHGSWMGLRESKKQGLI